MGHPAPSWQAPRLRARLADYWRDARRPLASLLFVAPLLMAYEACCTSDPTAVRVGADAWLRAALGGAGLTATLALPTLALIALVGWQHASGEPWRVGRQTLPAMACESLLLGALLWAPCQLTTRSVAPGGPAGAGALSLSGKADGPASIDPLEGAIGALGAGVYEEGFFRVALVPLASAAFAGLLGARGATLAAVALTSLAFAAAHHCGPLGEPLLARVFALRVVAGAYFAVVFLARGAGVAVGAHVAYDLLATLHDGA